MRIETECCVPQAADDSVFLGALAGMQQVSRGWLKHFAIGQGASSSSSSDTILVLEGSPTTIATTSM